MMNNKLNGKILEWVNLSKDRQSNIDNFDEMRKKLLSEEMKRQKEEKFMQLLTHIPLRYRGKVFNDYQTLNKEQSLAKKLCERYVETFVTRRQEGSSLIFMGKPGTGKTLLSLIMYQELAKKEFNVKYEASLEFINNLLDIKNQSQCHFQKNYQVYRDCDFLILDEVTESINKNGAPTQIGSQLIFKIINDRYNANLCTLVITNRSKDELISRLGFPFLDRLLEKGNCIAFNWNSFRQ